MKNFRYATRTEVEEHHFCFEDKLVRGGGLGFDADYQGVILNPLSLCDAAVENLLRGLFGTRYSKPYLETRYHTRREPASGTCDCGRVVYLDDPMTNHCACGAFYNGSGQRLAHPSQWGEETGERFTDYGSEIL